MKKILVILMIAVSLFAMVSCKEEASTITVGGDGMIYVHFEDDQAVKHVTANYKGEAYVDYYKCTSAYPVFDEFGWARTLDEWISLISLVNTTGSKTDFQLAITIDGDVIDFLSDVIDQAATIVKVGDITVQADNLQDLLQMLGISGENLDIDIATTLNLALKEENWENLAFSPIYINTSIYGLLLDWLNYNMSFTETRGAVEVENEAFTTLKICSKSQTFATKTFEKVNAPAKVTYVVNNGKVTYIGDFKKGVTYLIKIDGHRFVKFTPKADANDIVCAANFSKESTNCRESGTIEKNSKYGEFVWAMKDGCIPGFYGTLF